MPCEPGTFKDTVGADSCLPCLENNYCPSASALPRACPPNSTSPAASESVHACACEEGLVLVLSEDTYKCKPCDADTYYSRDAATSVGICVPCQAGAGSATGSRSERDCLCKPGFLVVSASAAYSCTSCGAGTFSDTSNASVCNSCAAGKSSASIAASSSSTCQACASGSVALSPGMSACVPCPASTWQDLDMPGHLSSACTPCPDNSAHALLGVYDVFECQCTAGMYKNNDRNGSFSCSSCEPGYSCSAEVASVVMTLTLGLPLSVETFTSELQLDFRMAIAETAGVDVSNVFIVSISAQALSRRLLNLLRRMLSDSIAVDFAIYFESTINVTSVVVPTQTEINEELESRSLVTVVMLAEPVVTVYEQRELCPPTSFCAGGEEVSYCKPFSIAPLGATSADQCQCVPGYYSLNTTALCSKCPPGNFCPGGLAVRICPPNATSSAGAEAAEQCFCKHGHWRGCTRTRTGAFFNNSGQECNVIWTKPCVLCGANDICFNDTLLHCPENSVSEPGSSSAEHCQCLAGYAAEHS